MSITVPSITRFAELERWDVKYFVNRVNTKYPLISLAQIVTEHNEKVNPYEQPDKIFKILGVNNTSGIFHAYDAQGNEIRQPYKKVNSGDFAYNPYRINIGSIGRVPLEHDQSYISPAYVIFSIDEEIIHPDVFWFIIKSDFFNQTLRSATAGSVRMNLTYSLLETLKIPNPPLSVQETIVSFWKTAQQNVKQEENLLFELTVELDYYLNQNTSSFCQITKSNAFIASYKNAQQWDVKAGRAAAFITANPDFTRLGDHTEECTETIKPWDEPEKEWPIYGVSNKDGVFLSSVQVGKDFNAPYKKIEKNWFFHNPTRANVGSLGIVPEVPEDALTSPEYQVWRLKDGFIPEFMALMLRTDYFLSLVAFNRVGGVKQRMYYSNLAEIRLPHIPQEIQENFAKRQTEALAKIQAAHEILEHRKKEIEQMILGVKNVELAI